MSNTFNWKVEEQTLTKENPEFSYSYTFKIESVLSLSEKREILCKEDEEFKYLIGLADKIIMEQDTIKKDKTNKYFNTISLKAWIKKNDNRHKISTIPGYMGKLYYGYKEFNITSICLSETDYVKFINDSFHQYLWKLQLSEKEYFLSHDEYYVLLNKFVNECILPVSVFDDNIHLSSDGTTVDCVQIFKQHSSDESIYDVPYRDATIDELKELININNKLKAYLDELKKNCTIKY